MNADNDASCLLLSSLFGYMTKCMFLGVQNGAWCRYL